MVSPMTIWSLLLLVPVQSVSAVPVIPDGTYTYTWVLDGREIGETAFTVSTRVSGAKDGETTPPSNKTERRIVAEWSYSARGREMRSTNETVIDANTQAALRYSSRQATRVGGNWSTEDEVSAKVENGIMTVKTVTGLRVRKHDVITPVPGHFLALQAFEHLVFVMALAHVSGDELKRELIDPRGSNSLLKTTVTKEKTEGEKTRWSFNAPGMSGRVWLSKSGLVSRYEQGELAILLRPAKKSSPQKETTGN